MLTKQNSKAAISASPPLGLEKYVGPWTEQHAAHLLRRTVFGAALHDIKQFTSQGMDASISILTNIQALQNDVPLNYDFESDPEVPIGTSWINKPHTSANNNNNYRFRSLYAWTMSRILAKEINLREKMTLFWHNHFVVADLPDARLYYKYINIFRPNPLGNFKQYTKQITIDPAMLRYLNGSQNTKNAPNENYARELLELFTIGKGPQVAPGDHTHYTEGDIVAIAKILTGWIDVGTRNATIPEVSSNFRPNQHDTTNKQLSHRFNNAIINNAGANEYINLIDVIFKQEEVSKFIARKLYRWFVHYTITAQVETDVIIPLAKIIRDNDFEMKPAIIALLSSDHFYSEFGCMIKNPIDFMLGALNQTNTAITGDLSQKYASWFSLYSYTPLLQMRYFDAPNVAGWKAYYQEPSYYQSWLNSVTLPLRKSYTDAITTLNLVARGIRIDIDVLSFVAGTSYPKDLETLINDLALIFFAKPLSDNQVTALKEIVIPGLPDYEWTLEYEEYLNNPDNNNIRRAVDGKLRTLITYMMRMPEYQLS